VEGLSVPGEEHDAVRQMLLPGDMDMSRLSKSDPWFDISAYAKDEAEGDTAGDDSNEKATGKKSQFTFNPLQRTLTRRCSPSSLGKNQIVPESASHP
jgi:hypothetical protein